MLSAELQSQRAIGDGLRLGNRKPPPFTRQGAVTGRFVARCVCRHEGASLYHLTVAQRHRSGFPRVVVWQSWWARRSSAGSGGLAWFELLVVSHLRHRQPYMLSPILLSCMYTLGGGASPALHMLDLSHGQTFTETEISLPRQGRLLGPWQSALPVAGCSSPATLMDSISSTATLRCLRAGSR
ncbi:hypothetical protein HDV57DRAFT_488920 [Trichoderma longibrachiatum]